MTAQEFFRRVYMFLYYSTRRELKKKKKKTKSDLDKLRFYKNKLKEFE